ncbi:hypothetical protein GGP42_002522 [Salinibacter ruber]|nr:hypothetical protein [Salinibacter ruber]
MKAVLLHHICNRRCLQISFLSIRNGSNARSPLSAVSVISTLNFKTNLM